MKIIHLIFTLSVLTSCNTKQDAKESTRLSNQSKILIQNNKLDEALTVLEKSIQLDPTNYVAYNNRAYINTEKHKPSEQILADYYKALSIKPDYEISLHSLANYYFEIKNYDSTIARTNVYFEYADKHTFDKKMMQHNYAIRGESKYMLSKFDEAIFDLNKSLEFDSLDANIHIFLGDCYFYKNSIDKAIEEQTKAIQLDSSYYQAYLARARCYEKLNTLKFRTPAEQDYKTAFKIKPDAEDIYNTNSELFKQIKQINK